ncbi:inositol polyphosphate-5-phosphatase F [Homo sapiens]|uniref:Inositol polyphosphate-5-phosphatase F n=1 Tax=Homo sapiens TaxID=9606 RepID=A0A3B3IS98_HUMAN|nr:inositol polyphosphate-5-phosphatase F [Homo sapiens]KAI4077644.1 inositol polyphosphate-5-phosphatase F [Homo sapiens]
MELFQAKDHYILQQGERALWCSRRDGGLQLRPATDLLLAWNPICLGLVEGVIGKIQLHSEDSNWGHVYSAYLLCLCVLAHCRAIQKYSVPRC